MVLRPLQLHNATTFELPLAERQTVSQNQIARFIFRHFSVSPNRRHHTSQQPRLAHKTMLSSTWAYLDRIDKRSIIPDTASS
jgi:hypothetical protein